MGCAEVPARDEHEQPYSLWGSTDVMAAAAASAVQLTVAGVVWSSVRWIVGDDYGVAPVALGLACLFLFGPLIMATAGMLHSVVYTLPAATAARAVARRAGGPESRWRAVRRSPSGTSTDASASAGSLSQGSASGCLRSRPR